MTTKKTIGYIRVSSADQVEDGNSLTRQEELIKAYCSLKGLSNLEIIADRGISGFKDSREGYCKLKELCLSGEVETVIVYDLSRLSRSVRSTLSFIEDIVCPQNISFVSLSQNIDTSTPIGKAFLAITSVFNELYRSEISYKTKAAKAFKKSLNKKCSRFSPYGFIADLEGNLSPCPIEQSIIFEMKQLKAEGYPFKSIANLLNQNKRKTKSGKGRWFTQTVSDILKREIKA